MLGTTPFSEEVPERPPLLTIGQGVSVAAAAETALTVADVNRFGYLLHLEAICTVVSTAAGTWNLRAAVAGTSRLLLQQPVTAAVVGTRYCWAFPFPWKTDAINDQFTVEPSAATLGTWIFLVNGFHSSI